MGLYRAVKLLQKECFIIFDPTNNSVKPILEKIKDEEDYKGAFINSRECMENLDENSLLILVDVHSRGYVQNIRYS